MWNGALRFTMGHDGSRRVTAAEQSTEVHAQPRWLGIASAFSCCPIRTAIGLSLVTAFYGLWLGGLESFRVGDSECESEHRVDIMVKIVGASSIFALAAATSLDLDSMIASIGSSAESSYQPGL
jgi:hypothetical protein